MTPPKPTRRLRDYFFHYSWDELQVVLYLRNTMVLFYLGWGALGWVFRPLGSAEQSALLLGMLAAYPGYRLGKRIQARADPSALDSAERMVWQIGNVAKAFSGAAGLLLLHWLAFGGRPLA